MSPDDIVKLAMITSVVVLPALAITVRFALKPIVDAILRLKEGGLLPGSQSLAANQEVAMLAAEVHHLRDEMAQLQQSVARLQDAESFHRSLSERPAAAQIGPPPDA
jgi:hypothetical protein